MWIAWLGTHTRHPHVCPSACLRSLGRGAPRRAHEAALPRCCQQRVAGAAGAAGWSAGEARVLFPLHVHLRQRCRRGPARGLAPPHRRRTASACVDNSMLPGPNRLQTGLPLPSMLHGVAFRLGFGLARPGWTGRRRPAPWGDWRGDARSGSSLFSLRCSTLALHKRPSALTSRLQRCALSTTKVTKKTTGTWPACQVGPQRSISWLMHL